MNYTDLRKSNPPSSILLTQFHVLMIFDSQIIGVNHLSGEIVWERVFAKGSGRLKGFSKDERSGTLWVYGEKAIFEIRFDNEERDVWRILLQKEQFTEALGYCDAAQREMVLYAQANHLFERQQYEQAAEILAMSSRTFEEVALKFIQRGATQALKTYLINRLERYVEADKDEKQYVTQRIMISTWLVEIFLNQINDLKDSAQNAETHAKVVKEFHDFLATYQRHIDQETAFHLISSHGLEDEMMHFASLVRDYDKMISYHIAQCEYKKGVAILNSRDVPELFYRYAPLLFHYEPRLVVDSLMKVRSLDPSKFLPALMRYDTSRNEPGDNVNHAIRYIEFCLDLRVHPDKALYNYLISLYVKDEDESRLLNFIMSQDESYPCFDMKYALRVCHQAGKIRSCVHLYSFMKLYTDAVKLALSVHDLELAKKMADKYSEHGPDRRKLWLLISEYVVQEEKNTEKAIKILGECEDLHIEDILPLFPDNIRIGDFKDEISKALTKYTNDIAELKSQMSDYTQTADKIRSQIQQLKNRHGEISASRQCDVCFKPVLLRHFYLYPCSHAAHVDCAESVVRKHVSKCPQRMEYFPSSSFDLDDIEPVLGGLNWSVAQSKTDTVDFTGNIDRSNIKELSRSECIFCGDVMIEQVKIPFIEYDEEGEEVKSWQI
eukprot:TRINITY_DN10707_c0_g1_i1.p1 TRINITY_DN10707_c0_g1~~TRINITY_DN10707_c0_g1_i1.p1  ORF type:complete len:664 (-),score=170.26 TRINITY_DN10707_c0_g1_i1:2071-4062(-)